MFCYVNGVGDGGDGEEEKEVVQVYLVGQLNQR